MNQPPTPTTLKAMVESLRHHIHSRQCPMSHGGSKEFCGCSVDGKNATIDRILAAIEGHVLVPVEQLMDAQNFAASVYPGGTIHQKLCALVSSACLEREEGQG